MRSQTGHDQILSSRVSPLAAATPLPHEGKSALRSTSLEAEAYRGLRFALEPIVDPARLAAAGDGESEPAFLIAPETSRVIAVSSAEKGTGSTTTAINFAAALAEVPGANVLLVDADLRSASLAHRLGITAVASRKLPEVLLGDFSIEETLRNLPRVGRVAVLPSAPVPDVAHWVVGLPRMGALLAEARRMFDAVILDTPPLVPLTDCRALARWVDGFVVVVGANHTRRDRLEKALSVVAPGKLMGLVLNGVDP
ncbi:MAG TPA: CpsD/CapB family tyrosine-protein kinase [bacterium]|nr:CpsD/CapB family tyrosine-protein kinase [bacterium]